VGVELFLFDVVIRFLHCMVTYYEICSSALNLGSIVDLKMLAIYNAAKKTATQGNFRNAKTETLASMITLKR
jgi:hypothetical protein